MSHLEVVALQIQVRQLRQNLERGLQCDSALGCDSTLGQRQVANV
jgi:hypothetical protein